MANRAERRRQAREQQARMKLSGGGQMMMEASAAMSKDEIKRIEREIQKMQSGGYTGMMERDREKFQRRMEVHDQVRKIIEHNGITAQDLDNAREQGRQEGFKQARNRSSSAATRGLSLPCMTNSGLARTGLSGLSRPWTKRSSGR